MFLERIKEVYQYQIQDNYCYSKEIRDLISDLLKGFEDGTISETKPATRPGAYQTIQQIVDSATEEMCTSYCRYPKALTNLNELYDICKGCPMTRL